MKKIIGIQITLMLVLWACTPDKYEILDQKFNPEQIEYLEVRSNSHILYADGICELRLQYEAYDIIQQELKRLKVTENKDSITEIYTQIDTLALPPSRIPEGNIRYYKEDGTEIPGGVYKTSDFSKPFLKVYAQTGNIKSKLLEIDIRESFPVKEKIIYPVIFHIISSAGVQTPEITSEILQKRLNRLNEIFGRTHFFSSNGGNPNLEFRLAEYSNQGKALDEKGIHRTASTLKGSAVLKDIQKYVWNPKQYLNIWICTYPSTVTTPVTVLESAAGDAIQGLAFSEIISETANVGTTVPENIGIVIGAKYSSYSKEYTWAFYNYEWENSFGTYFGLLGTNISNEKNGDFCSDTYAYDNSTLNNPNYSKKSKDGYIYNSENIMDSPSRVTTISAEQAQRVRWVTENCPSRWAYKSNFAFTGK